MQGLINMITDFVPTLNEINHEVRQKHKGHQIKIASDQINWNRMQYTMRGHRPNPYRIIAIMPWVFKKRGVIAL